MPRMDLATKATRRQKRMIARRDEAMPLFVAAGIADEIQPIPDVPEIERYYRQEQATVCAMLLRHRRDDLRDWIRLRAMAEEYVTPDQAQRMETQSCRTYPSDPGYRADYWRRFLGALGLWARVLDVNPLIAGQRQVFWDGAYLDLETGEWKGGGYGMAKD